jgi:L,D-peptidoglycan transpeptidase YkuD (ErfK/YbiS/YcfS/YnhG family)
MQNKTISLIITVVTVLFSSCSNGPVTSGVSTSSWQLVLVVAEVVADSVQSTQGVLTRFERQTGNSKWQQTGERIAVVLGRNGLGLGRGLHDPMGVEDFPVKKEGDGKSPAGIFGLSAVFGYAAPDEMQDLNMPYLHVTEFTECIDDAQSHDYNRIVSRDSLGQSQDTDWTSSEKMSRAGIYYELGVVVDHNTGPVQAGAGSCIFIHNWTDPHETSAGCTEMAPENMRDLAYWLDIDRKPVLVQLTRGLYDEFKDSWELPDVTDQYQTH